ncbi:alpha-ketoacid dehydrogenase subunit beta [bacterium]|nr:alpha-ketoacid dehydrogenase subunit beta [bacterium]
MNHKDMTFASAVNDAIATEMRRDEKVISIGLGHNDPKRIFGTTAGLMEEFGPERAREMPISENAVTGVLVGLGLKGFKPILTHQRVDFALLSMDQIVNSAAKWRLMFNRVQGLPLVIRMIIGRGWGQGPTHSQSLQSWFAHIPGLKVLMPSNARDAKGMLAYAIQDPNPVIFLEHRWLHNTHDNVPVQRFTINPLLPKVVSEGTDCTVVASNIMVVEALKAKKHLERYNINLEVIDVASIRPFECAPIVESVEKTHNLIVLDNENLIGSFSAEIISQICERCFSSLHSEPVRLASVDLPFPTSHALTKNIYADANTLIDAISKKFDVQIPLIEKSMPHDIPGNWFNGPF